VSVERRKLTREQVEQIVREAREKGKRPDLNRVDLSGANLSGVDLSGADLSGADLGGTILNGANLRGADFSGAYLGGTDFIEANLGEANLSEVNLSRANLTGANLTGANLSGANLIVAMLRGTTLSGANLSEAYLGGATFTRTAFDDTIFSNAIIEETSFIEVDLSEAKGLIEVQHKSHSIIDINTIYQSKDKIPEVFLKGAGVHPDIIRWQHSLHTPTVFICYSHKDEKEKDQLITHLGGLKQLDLIDIWDDSQITPGTVWEQEVLQAITRSTVAILLVSANFLNSDVINTLEIPQFLERHAKDETFLLYPIIIKPCSWETVPWLNRLQVRPKGGKPIWGGKTKVDAELSKIATEVIEVFKNHWRR
jgi:hypothetical protein